MLNPPLGFLSESRTGWGLRIHVPRESLRAAAAADVGSVVVGMATGQKPLAMFYSVPFLPL